MQNKTFLEKFPFLQSSADPEKMSLTIKGILTGVVAFLTFTNVLPADAVADIAPLTDALVTGIQGALAGIAAVATAWGAIRKVYNKWFK